jgi:hypothetical protein
LTLVNALGVVVKNITSNNAQVQMDLQGLPAGFYMLQVTQDGHKAIKRLVIR